MSALFVSFAMDALPVELKKTICGFVADRHDLGNLGRTSSQFASAGEEFLLNEVTLEHTQMSRDKLLDLAKHQKLSKYVTTLTINPAYAIEEDYTA